MAGKPEARKKRAAALRAEALRIAAADGAAAASRATGLRQSTIRSALTRERARAARAAEAAARSVPVSVLPATEGSAVGDRLASMRKARDSHRRVEGQALEQTSALLAAGNGTEARNVATAGGIASDKALALDKAIVAAEAEAEAEAVRLQRGTLDLQAAVLRAVFVAIDVPPPVASLRLLAGQAAAGEELQVPEEIASEERERVRVKVRAEYLEELIAEGWAPPADDDEETEDEELEPDDEPREVVDAEPALEDAPEDGDELRWSEEEVLDNGSTVTSHPIPRGGGVIEREGPGAGRRNRYDFGHPGLR